MYKQLILCLLWLQCTVKGECLQNTKAADRLQKWARSRPQQTNTIDLDGTPLSVIQSNNKDVWYIASDGLEGAFYYASLMNDKPGIQRKGAYLYPDYYTAIVGVWKDHVLVSGKTTRLTEACRSGNAWTLKFRELHGPTQAYSPPSKYSIGVKPLERDPFEARIVEVKNSIIPGAQHGLFTKRNVNKGDIVAFYSGYKFNCNNQWKSQNSDKKGNTVDHILHQRMYTLALGIDNLCISLPPEVGKDVNKYNATLGHKANHSFDPNTEIYIFSIHPILGKTKILVAVKDILAGSEITVDYGYENNPVKPSWFLQQLNEYFRKMQTDIMERFPMFII